MDVTSTWEIDTFGHHAQEPQILKLAGFKVCWLKRGLPNWRVPSEFFWEGLDGTRISTYWLPRDYMLVWGAPKSLPEFAKFVKNGYDSLAPFTKGACRVGLAGADVCPPEGSEVPEFREGDLTYATR